MNRRKMLLLGAWMPFALANASRADTCFEHVSDIDPSIRAAAVELMALNIYFHRGDKNTVEGKKAITAVVINRVRDCEHHWPRTIRGVITGGSERGKNCDFSWYCDGRSDKPENSEQYQADTRLAAKWLDEYLEGAFEDVTDGATWFIYKEQAPPPSWPTLKKTGTFGEYTFYRYP